MKERVIGTIHERQEDGQFRQVAEQDLTNMSFFELWYFYRLQHFLNRVIIPKRKGVGHE